MHVSAGTVSAGVVSVSLQSVGCSTIVTGSICCREVSEGCWCSSGGVSVSWWGVGWFMTECGWVCGLEVGQFAIVEWGGVGGWVRGWVVSDVLVGVSVRGGCVEVRGCGSSCTGVVFTGQSVTVGVCIFTGEGTVAVSSDVVPGGTFFSMGCSNIDTFGLDSGQVVADRWSCVVLGVRVQVWGWWC